MRENNLDLMPHQEVGYEFALQREHPYLAFDMGLGKTGIALTLLLRNPEHTAICICPGYLRDNWVAEAHKWGIPKNEVQCIKKRKDKIQYKRLTILSFDALAIKNVLKQTVGVDWLFIDEAHYIRGKGAQRTKYILGSDIRVPKFAVAYASQCLYLSGTPMLNRPIDLWPILRAVFPDDKLIRDYYQYAYHFCGAYDGNFGIDVSGASNLEELKGEYLDKFMLRQKKEDVLDLPSKVFVQMDIEMNKMSLELVKKENDLNLDIDMLISGEMAIGEYATVRRELGLLKLAYCVEHIKNVLTQTGAVVVFVYHQAFAKALAEEFKTTPVIGSTPNAKRTELVADFQRDGGCFVGSYGAAGTGITLTKAADVVLCELDYSPRSIDQAVDRLHRIGQDKKVTIHTLLWREGLEKVFYKQLQKKDEVFHSLF